MNKAFIISTDRGDVKNFIAEVLRYIEEQKNWNKGWARTCVGWSDMRMGETAIVAQPNIDRKLFRDALDFAKTETGVDFKLDRPASYMGEDAAEDEEGVYTIVFVNRHTGKVDVIAEYESKQAAKDALYMLSSAVERVPSGFAKRSFGEFKIDRA